MMGEIQTGPKDGGTSIRARAVSKDVNMFWNKIVKIGLACSFCYVVLALYIGSEFCITVSDKNRIVAQMEQSVSVAESCNVARPFISVLYYTYSLGKYMFFISSGIVVLNMIIFSLLLLKKQSPVNRLIEHSEG